MEEFPGSPSATAPPAAYPAALAVTLAFRMLHSVRESVKPLPLSASTPMML
jgi:hypothetical protein